MGSCSVSVSRQSVVVGITIWRPKRKNDLFRFVRFVSFRCIWLVLSRLLCCIPSCCCIVGYTFHDDGPKGDYEETHKRPAGRTNNQQLEYQSSCPLHQQLLLLLTYFFGLPIFISFHFLSRFFFPLHLFFILLTRLHCLLFPAPSTSSLLHRVIQSTTTTTRIK